MLQLRPDVMAGRAKSLELRDRPSGPRYYLAGRPLVGCSTVQLCFSGGWVTGRFEWSGNPDEPPRFHCSIEQEVGGVVDHVLDIPEKALLRWPQS
jgi:hypothetical protein